jgi:glycine betaine/proline transport system permease protein
MAVGSVSESKSNARARLAAFWFPIVAVTVICLLAAEFIPGANLYPAEGVIPVKKWVSQFFEWLMKEVAIGPVTVRDITRGISWLLSWPIAWVEALLFGGIRQFELPPLPWVAIIVGAGILGHWVKGVRLGLFCMACLLYMAVFGLWSDSMRTLALVLVAVPFAALVGLVLGIAAVRSRRMEAIITTAFDIMQATPHMAYLAPVVILFGFGQVPALLATIIFALPVMARCVILGIRTVPSDVLEAGRMSGCTRWQMLWKVELPAAHQTVMLGLNQVVMQTLAMAVICSLVGASGLGEKLLFSLNQLYIGKATEQGIAIVLMAILLDRMTQAYAYRQPMRITTGASRWFRHRHLLAFVGVFVVCYLLAIFIPEFRVPPKEMTVSFGSQVDLGVRWVSKNLYPYIQPVREWITLYLLLPLRNFLLWLPWPLVIALIGLTGWRLGGRRLCLLTVCLVASILLVGNWEVGIMTVYLVAAAALLCVMIGVPIGIWASRSERAARAIMAVCDTLQTFPSFIYLIPVIMLLQTSDLSNVLAILAYASVPAVRYTYLGLIRIPPVIIEAARAAGCTARQRLWKVEMPIALPEIMLGINQTIMMALAMTAITALIGSRDLGQEIYKALPGRDTGRGILAGLGIAIIGIVADRLIGAWAKRRKRELGFT